MAVQNESNLATAQTVAREKFTEIFQGPAPGAGMLFAEEYDSNSLTDNVSFLALMGTVREWLGDRVSNSFVAYAQSIVLRKWELTFGLPRTFVEYDTTGGVGRALSSAIAQVRANSDDKLIFDSLVSNSGAGPVGFDLLNLLSTAHVIGSQSAQSNKTTSALSFTTYDTAYQTVTGYVGASGESLNAVPKTLVVGPKMLRTALEIANADSVPVTVSTAGAIEYPGTAQTGNVSPGSGIMNVYKGQVDVVMWNRLTGAYDDYWYLLSEVGGGGAKPMLLKRNREWELIERTSLTDDARWTRDAYEWAIEADKAPAAGAWPAIYGGIL